VSHAKKRLELAYAQILARLSRSDAASKRLKDQELNYDRYTSHRQDFADLMARTDHGKPVKRIFVMGCGRSGTWLMYSLLSMVKDAYVFFEEVDVGRFARIKSRKPIHILKRDAKSFRTAGLIPESIGIVWLVRHPFDVVTSHNPQKGKRFHLKPDRWVKEIDALRRFLEHPRPNVVVVRYEDLTSNADATLSRIAAAFGVDVSGRARDFVNDAQIPADVLATMHGLRSISTNSVGRWRSEPERMQRVRDVVPSMGEHLEWVSERFGYDVTLP
jgi:hypothetical protein